MKKLITKLEVLVAVMLLFSLTMINIANAATTESGLTYQLGNYENAIITGMEGTATSVEIPSNIENCSVEVQESAFAGNTSLQSVTLSNDVIVYSDAFSGCSNLKDVSIGDDVALIGKNIFSGTAIEELHFGKYVQIESGLFNGMNNLKAIYFNASNYGIGNTDFQLDATSEEYIKNNVTIYLYSSEDPSEDNSDDGKTWYTPIAWAENHGFNYVNLSEGTTDYVERTLVDEKTGIKVTGKMSKDATMEIIKYAKGSAGLSYLLTGYEKDDILCGYNVLINGNYDGEFEISVPITEEFGNKEPAIQHSENYILKPIKSSIKNNMITFKMNPLDVFLIQLSDKKDEPTNTPTTKPTPTPSTPAGSGTGASSDRVLDDSPKTGANGIMVEMICLTIIGVVGLSFLLKKIK